MIGRETRALKTVVLDGVTGYLMKRAAGHQRPEFEAVADRKITDKEIGELQALLGYHPAGYGIGRVRQERDVTGSSVACWDCSHTCD